MRMQYCTTRILHESMRGIDELVGFAQSHSFRPLLCVSSLAAVARVQKNGCGNGGEWRWEDKNKGWKC
jgi:hypothetical protein